MKKKNSLIELYRFIFAMAVVNYHGYFPFNTPYLSAGRLSVEFFFILSGYLLVRSVDKFMDMKLYKGAIKFIWSKIYPIIIPLSIGILCNIIGMFKDNEFSVNIFGFLWYVKQMLSMSLYYFILRYFIKNKNINLAIIVSIFVIYAVLNCYEDYYQRGDVRAIAAMSLGVIIAYIPSINEKFSKKVWYALVPIQLATLCLMLFSNNLWADNYLVLERIAHWGLYPLMIYLTFQVKCHNKVFDYLGSISFGLYAFQCVASCMSKYGVTNVYVLFLVIVVLSIIERFVKVILKNKKRVSC